MIVTDFRWAELATEAKVRPPHIFMLWHWLSAGAPVEHFAKFANMEARHVEAMLAALELHGLLPKPKRRSGRAAQTAHPNQNQLNGTRLAPVLQLPDDWLAYAQTKRRWDKPTVEDVLADFIEHWSNRTDSRAVKLDWFQTWQTWVRRDRRENGNWSPASALSQADFNARCEEIAIGWERMNNPMEALKWRGKMR